MCAYPTSLWDAGEIIRDQTELALVDLEPGRYQVVAGLYEPTTGQRLRVAESADDTIVLYTFEVAEE